MEPLRPSPFLPRQALIDRINASPCRLIALCAPKSTGKSMTLLALARHAKAKNKSYTWADIGMLGAAPTADLILLDDVEASANPQKLFETLLCAQPDQKIIIALDHPLPRQLREAWIAGRCAVFGARDLAFGLDEAAALFGLAQPTLEVQLLHQFVNGWALGLSLLSRDCDSAFMLTRRDGAHQPLPALVDAWFEDAVSTRLNPRSLALLMDLAIFGDFPLQVVQTLPEPYAPEILHPLLQQGLFLYESPHATGHIRIQPAFARHLRHRLALHDPQRAAQMQAFALEWYKKQADPSGMIRHAMAALEAEAALEVINGTGAIAVALSTGPNLELASPISAQSAFHSPLTFFALIYERVRLGAVSEARLHYENAARLTQGFTAFSCAHDPIVIRGWTLSFEAIFGFYEDRSFAPDWLEELENYFRDAASRNPLLAVTLSSVMTLIPLDMGARDAALKASVLGLQLQERVRADKVALFTHLHRASALIVNAQLDKAMAEIQAAHRLASRETHADSYELVSCQIHAGLCHFEQGDDKRAYALLSACADQLAAIHGWRRVWSEYFAAIAELAQAAGDDEACERWLAQGDDLAALHNQSKLKFALLLTRAELALEAGQISKAQAYAQDAQMLAAAQSEMPPALSHRAQILAVELLFALGQKEAAISQMAHLQPCAITACDLRLALRLRLLELCAASHRQDEMATLVAALRNITRLAPKLPRMARKPALAQAITDCLHQNPRLENLLEKEELAFINGLKRPQHPPLSPRERQIITLIVDGLATKEIARLLQISEGTVKSHRKNMYEKLGVNSRSKVIACAKALALV